MKRKLIKYHRILGLFLSLNFLILAITGTVLIWRDEIEGSSDQKSETSFEVKDSFVLIEKKLMSRFPQKKILSIFKDDAGQFQARVGKKNQYKFKGAIRKQYSPLGEEISSGQSDSGIINFILRLHREILLGGKGKILIAFIGVILIFIVISGFLIIPFFKGLKSREELRFKISRIHQKIGALTTAWLILITFTGVFLGLNSTLIALFLKGQLTERSTTEAKVIELNDVPSVDGVVANLATLAPDFEPDFISYPNNEFSLPGHFGVLLKKGREEKIVFVNAFDITDAQIVELPWYLKLLISSEPLHFGNYGGVILKVFWTVFALLSMIIPLTGLINYYFRKILKSKTRIEKTTSTKFASFTCLLFGGLQSLSLGMIPIIGSQSGYGTPVVVITFGITILLFMLSARFWAQRFSSLSLVNIYRVSCFGMLLGASLLGLAVTQSGLSSLILYITARVAFCSLSSMTVQITQVYRLSLVESEVDQGLLNTAIPLNIGRLIGLSLVGVFGLAVHLSLSVWAVLVGLLLVYSFKVSLENPKLKVQKKTAFIPKDILNVFKHISAVLAFAFIIGALNSYFPIIISKLDIERSLQKVLLFRVLLMANILILISQVVVKYFRFSQSKFFIPLVLILNAGLVFSVIRSGTLLNTLVLGSFGAFVASLVPLAYGKSLYTHFKVEDRADLSSYISIGQTLGNALGAIIIGLIAHLDLAVWGYFLLLSLFLSVKLFRDHRIVKGASYAQS